jgi:zinc D-Ala-D-Ala carboxypeptidase
MFKKYWPFMLLGLFVIAGGGAIALKYFKRSEFDSQATPEDIAAGKPTYTKNGRTYLTDSGKNMNPIFLKILDKARSLANIPFNISSGYRTKAWELKQGRSGKSAHTLGMAVDVGFDSIAQRDAIIKAAIKAGITRIGIANNFIHLDIADKADPQLYATKYWGYPSGTQAAAPFNPFTKFA